MQAEAWTGHTQGMTIRKGNIDIWFNFFKILFDASLEYHNIFYTNPILKKKIFLVLYILGRI